jgi:hypothetical protein
MTQIRYVRKWAAYLVHMTRGRVKMEKMSYRWMRDE